MVNVPTAVWIDEEGRIVRPNEVAFADNRWIEYTQFDMTRYRAAIRDWVEQAGYAGYSEVEIFSAENWWKRAGGENN